MAQSKDKPEDLDAPKQVKVMGKRFSSRTKTLIVIGVVIAIGLAGWFCYDRFVRKDLMTGKNIDFTHVPKEVTELSEASKPAEEGNLQGSMAAFDALAAKTSDNAKKAAIYSAMGNVCVTYNDYACALAAHEQAMALQPNNVQYIELAAADAQALGQKDKANQYYQQLINLLQNDSSPTAQQKVKYLQNLINGVQSSGGDS